MELSLKEKKEFNPLKLSLFTSTVHFIADAIIYPFDTLATRIRANRKQFRSMGQELKHVLKNEGPKGLYRGVASTFHCGFTPTFVYFMFYENLSQYSFNYMKHQNQDSKFNQFIKYSIPFWIAGLSEAISLFFYLPFDIVRTRLQINDPQYQYKGLFQGIQDVVKKEGWIRLYKASHIYITVTTLQTSLQFQFYEVLREYYLKQYHQQHLETQQQYLGFKQSLAVTTIASGLAAFIGNPLDLLLTRYQIIDSSKQKMSAVKIVKDLIREEGFKGFFKGLTARMYYACGFSVLWMPFYDYYKGQYGVQIDL